MNNIFETDLLSNYQIRTLTILTKSEQLLLRYGYSKVTIDDIARECGLGKGTVYLHFKSKENLFYAVFLKAAAEITGYIIDYLKQDFSNANLAELLVESYTACYNRELIVALFTKNSLLLGKLLQNKHSSASQELKLGLLKESLTMYREHNFVKQNMSVEMQLHTINMILLGMFHYNSHLNDLLPLESQQIMLYQTIKDTFSTTSNQAINNELYDYVLNQFLTMLKFYKQQIFKLTVKSN